MIMYLRGLKSPVIKGMSLLQMPLPKSKHSLDRTLITTCLLRSNTSVNPSKHILRSQHSLAYEHTIVKTEWQPNASGFRLLPILRTTHYVRLYYPSYLHLIPLVPKAYVLGRSEPIPDPPKVTDTSCGKCYLLIPIDESKLQYTLPATESAIIRECELPNNIIAVIRDFITISSNLGLSISSRIPSIGEHYLNEMGQENWQRCE